MITSSAMRAIDDCCKFDVRYNTFCHWSKVLDKLFDMILIMIFGDLIKFRIHYALGFTVDNIGTIS